MPSPSTTARIATAVSLVLTMHACADDEPTGIGPLREDSEHEISACQDQCIIFEDMTPFKTAQANHVLPDSVGSHVLLADFIVRGSPGGTVTAALEASDRVLATLADIRIGIAIDGVARLYSLDELAKHVTLHTFTQRGDVNIHYMLPRNVRVVPAEGTLHLTQIGHLVQVREAITPWAGRVGIPVVSNNVIDPDCTAAVPGPGTYCDGAVTVDISPYATGGPFGGFQSGSGTGASSTITIDFSAPVSSVAITVQDPTFDGNAMVATGPDFAGSVAFAGSQEPGVNVPQTGSISGN